MADHCRAVGLTETADTLRLGAVLAEVMKNAPGVTVLLLRGDLGSGKTTFVRGLAGSLPGGGEAEVASPSFNLVNIYPTRPEVVHMDLYRLHGEESRELFEEYADPAGQAGGSVLDSPRIVAVEWAEHLPDACLARGHLDISLTAAATGRTVRITGHGPDGETLMARLSPELDAFPGIGRTGA